MRSKTPSSADHVLLEELRKRGCAVSLTQIERWRYWRGTGLVPRPIQHGKGRGSYSKYADPQDVAERVCEIAQLRARYRSLDEIAVVLSARGRPLDPASVKQALAAVLESSEQAFRSHEPVSDDPIEIAHNAARALKRASGRGARSPANRRDGTAPLALPDTALAIGGRVLAGVPVPSSELETFLEESGLTLIASHLGHSATGLLRMIEQAAPHASFAAARTLIEQAGAEAIVAALRAANQAIETLVPPRFFPSATSRDVAVVGGALGLLTADRPASPMHDA